MKLTVSIITYNHVNFIAQAIESVLMQQTDFDVEILIGEDDSNDGTREIVKKYEAKYPDKIRVFYHTYPPDHKRVNGRLNFANNIKNAKGKYIALLDGDDYWTDPYKLQKQVDFLESHSGFSFCFTNSEIIYDDGRPSHLSNFEDNDTEFTIEALVDKNFIMTASCVFKNYLFGDFPKWYFKLAFGDWSLHILNAKHGKIGYINQVMSVYRIHAGGLWSSNWSNKISIDKRIVNLHSRITFYDYINKYLAFKYNRQIKNRILQLHREVIDLSVKNKKTNKYFIKSLNYCIRHGGGDKRLAWKNLIKAFFKVHFPAFYSTFFRLRAKFS